MAPGRDRDPLLAGGLPTQYVDVDPAVTSEWVESFDQLVNEGGNYRIIERRELAAQEGA